jgi:hypothetical protein
LLKDYDNLWVFGDSYTTPDVCVSPKNSFWGLTATHANIPTIRNCSRSANSFDTVMHLVVSMQNEFNWERDLLLIGIPPLERITVFDNYVNTEYHGTNFDTASWNQSKFLINYHRGLVCMQNFGKDKTLITHENRSWNEAQALRNIFLLTAWLDAKQANYMILNLSKSLDRNCLWGPSEFLLPYAEAHQRCILFEDGYNGINLGINQPADYDKSGWNGHHGLAGNQYFFEKSLWPQLKQCNLI